MLSKGMVSFSSEVSYSNVGPVAQSVQRLTTGWTVRDRIPVGTRYSALSDRPWGPPSLLLNGYRVFPGGKVRPGRVADHIPRSSAAVMEEQSYTSTHPLGHTGPVTVVLYLLLYQLFTTGTPHLKVAMYLECLDQRFPSCAPRSPKGSACTSQGLRGCSRKILYWWQLRIN